MTQSSADYIADYLQRHLVVARQAVTELTPTVTELANRMVQALRAGGKVLLFGNGGSAADAQHFAAELVGRFAVERRGLPALALTVDSSILTAVGNDYGFDQVFRRQVEALAAPGDVVIGLSTSGNSANVLAGLLAARERGCLTVGLLGGDGGAIGPQVEVALVVPVRETPLVQEVHGLLVHLLCGLIDRERIVP